MAYDPRDCGARCSPSRGRAGCPLGPEGMLRNLDAIPEPWVPVRWEDHTNNHPAVIAVAESPADEEVRRGFPLAGPSGMTWNEGLLAIGQRRPRMSLSNLLACRVPGKPSGAWKRVEKMLTRLRKTYGQRYIEEGKADNATQARRMAAEALPHPAACCRPRLLGEIRKHDGVVALGSEPLKWLTGRTGGIKRNRGGPLWVELSVGDIHEVAPDYEPSPPHTLDAVPLHPPRKLKLFPTFHPAFINRSPSWKPDWHRDLGKALRFFEDRLTWVDPQIVVNPPVEWLAHFLSHDAWGPQAFWACDTETNSIDPLRATLEMIQISNADGSIVVVLTPTRVIDKGAYTVLGWDPTIRRLVSEFFVDPFRMKVGHNVGSYDWLVMLTNWGIEMRGFCDTLFPSRFRSPDTAKDLKTVSTILTDIHRWETDEKGEKHAMRSGTPEVRIRYGALDASANARIVPALMAAARDAGAFDAPPVAVPPSWPSSRPWNLWNIDHEAQVFCREMQRSGLRVCREAHGLLRDVYEASCARRRGVLESIAASTGMRWLDPAALNDGRDDATSEERKLHHEVNESRRRAGKKKKLGAMNPGSYDQVRELIYDDWHLGTPPTLDARDFYTDTQLPGTGAQVLLAHLARRDLTEMQRTFIKELLLYRRERNKILGVWINPLVPRSEGGLVDADGRVRAMSWAAHITSVGRLRCGGLPLQTIGSRKGLGVLKLLFRAERGRVYLYSDFNQAHLRIIANLWKIPSLVDAFTQGLDPYGVVAYRTLFGDAYARADGWPGGAFDLRGDKPEGKAGGLRQTTKTFLLASCYAAEAPTKWKVMVATEPRAGHWPYLQRKESDIERLDKKWRASEPEWERAWDGEMALYHSNGGWLKDPILGRRSGTLDGGKREKVANFRTLAAEAGAARIAECEVRSRWPFEYAGRGTGVVYNGHDALVAEAVARDAADAERQAAELGRLMTVRVPGWDIPLTTEHSWGHTMVGDYKKEEKMLTELRRRAVEARAA